MSESQRKTALEVLRAGRELISDPARWTQHQFAKDAAGDFVDPGSRYAVCWCSLGAFTRVNPFISQNRAAKTLLANAMGLGWGCITKFNDNHAHDQVIAAWDRAIAMAEAQPAS